MGGLSDFLARRESSPVQKGDSQTGAATTCGRPGLSCDGVGGMGGAARAGSRDSQASEALRAGLMRIAKTEGIPDAIVATIEPRDLGACAGLPKSTLGAYLRALQRSSEMAEGRVPIGWTQIADCAGCGPVWLPPAMPSTVVACPWCRHRRVGRRVPMPSI